MDILTALLVGISSGLLMWAAEYYWKVLFRYPLEFAKAANARETELSNQIADLGKRIAEQHQFEIVPRLLPIDDIDHVFVFQNDGPEVTQFRFKLVGAAGRGLKIHGVSIGREIVFPKILKGQRMQAEMWIGDKDPRQYVAEWSWKSADGRDHTQTGLIQAESPAGGGTTIFG
jgi:hypothetical protein